MRALLWLGIAAAASAQTQPAERAIPSESEVGAVAFSRDGLLAGVCRDRKVRVWDPASGALKRTVTLSMGDLGPTIPNPADVLAASAADGSIRLWSLTSDAEPSRTGGGGPRVFRIALSPDRKLVAGATRGAAGGSETAVHLWETAGKRRFEAPAGIGGIASMAISPDGGTLVAGSYDTDVRAWNTHNGELLRLIDEVPMSLFAMAFSPDGKYLAAAGADSTLYLFDAKTWRPVHKWTGSPEMISTLAFSPDGKTIVSGGFSVITVRHPVSIQFWDAATGRVKRRVPAPRQVVSVAYSPDGKWVAASDTGKTIRLLPAL